MNTKYVKIQVNKNEMYNEYQRANIGNDVYEAGAYMSGFEDSERQFKEVPDHSEEMLSALSEIMRFKHELRLVMSDKLQYPDNFLKALDNAEELINKIEEYGK
ncbi:hypothetical protein [Elizabethkingia miricola]|uniref:Phage protein n=1 Tax=Elizabethkingia miricola TaxID=172045 RepID=A0ABD5B3L9_ELIMR|nr:hypothetical protein [Elizabethkingia miricola]MDQ8748360.1 hypothetical protein [Elizabethkingia miricola]